MSSTMASASRNSLSDGATRLPSRLTTPTAMAMSVAIGMPQPSDPVPADVDRDVDQGGHDHAADGGDRRQRGGPRVAQLALDELALDLEADDEEEDRHQRVVDPLLQVEVDRVAADRDRHVGVPQVEVRLLPRRVRPDQRDHRRGDEHDAARGLLVEEVAQGVDRDDGESSVTRAGAA